MRNILILLLTLFITGCGKAQRPPQVISKSVMDEIRITGPEIPHVNRLPIPSEGIPLIIGEPEGHDVQHGQTLLGYTKTADFKYIEITIKPGLSEARAKHVLAHEYGHAFMSFNNDEEEVVKEIVAEGLSYTYLTDDFNIQKLMSVGINYVNTVLGLRPTEEQSARARLLIEYYLMRGFVKACRAFVDAKYKAYEQQ